MKWTVYDPQSGAILRSGQSHDEAAALAQGRAGEAVLLGEELRDDLFVIIDGQAVDRILTGDELAEIRAQRKAGIDREAGFARGAIITIAAGQDYVYARKLAEAERVIALSALAAEVPMIAAEAEADGMALAAKAAQVVAASQASSAALAAIEVKRRAAKAAIDAAATKAEIEAAAVVVW